MINKKYILWLLILIPITIGIFIIIQQRVNFLSAKFSDKLELSPVIKTIPSPPEIIKAVYLTSSSGGSEKKIKWLIDLANKSGLNSVVIDIKDFSGYIAYDSNVVDAEKYRTEKIKIEDIEGLIRRLHNNNIYVIARMAVFQDPALVRARPDWAVKTITKGIWYDHKGLTWIDPSNREAWKYFADLAEDAADLGFNEINFDYIRFPSDGNLSTMVFPGWSTETSRIQIIREFYKYLRGRLGETRMSADLFGFVTTKKEDFGVGQVIEDAFEYFDFISPMVYPSHYPATYMGFANPAEHPYEVVNYSMKEGIERLRKYKLQNPENKTELRPWLQDFSLGANYTQVMVEAEIKAAQDALGDDYKGFMLWNARNVYHTSVFK